MERIFQILAVILIGIAAFFLWRGNWDGVFVAAVIGAVCFFVSFRFQVKERLEKRAAAKLEEESKVSEEEVVEQNEQESEENSK